MKDEFAVKSAFFIYHRYVCLVSLLLVWGANPLYLQANPTGGSVVGGDVNAIISGQGTSLTTINQSAQQAIINWQNFNIASGETVNFNQPSSSSVTWNVINDPNPGGSYINGNINAMGYVILQNPNGFTIGGLASITAHGLIMTTASTPALNLSSGGPWSFNTPPPTKSIVNYGQINITGGGSAFLIADDVENNGTISAPRGKIGLYAGQTVLVSMSPDGRGLSAKATIPQGLVDNNGNLVADAGNITLQAQMVNQNGLVQANSALNVNGSIELVAGDTLNLNVNSTISAAGSGSPATAPGSGVSLQAGNTVNNNGQVIADGSSILLTAPTVYQNGTLQANSLGTVNGAIAIDAPGDSGNLTLGASSVISASGQLSLSTPSPGGFVVLHSGNSFSDSVGSQINVSGGTGVGGGQNGIVEIFGKGVTAGALQSGYGSPYALLINPDNLTLSTGVTSTSPAGPNLNLSDLLNYYQVYLYNVHLASSWDPGVTAVPATLNWSAINNITLDGSLSIGNNWSVNLVAGTAFPSGASPTPANDGIYLNGTASIQAQNGTINLDAANEVIVGNGAIRTVGGGSIDVTAQYGNVNCGTSSYGFDFLTTAPYYKPDANLGGISTAAGGNVTINAGGDVNSFAAEQITSTMTSDPGSGAFGSQPGNVTINAGGSVYGHFVEVNGKGTINAGQNIGIGPTPANPNDQDVALSLVKGSWNLNAGWDPNTQSVQSGVGNIFLQEVRNPNGIFDTLSTLKLGKKVATPGNHLFDYDPQASVSLSAGNGVYLTGNNLPRPHASTDAASVGVPMLLPPIVIIDAGPGGITLQSPIVDIAPNLTSLADSDITLFPSPYQNLEITTTDGGSFNGNGVTLLMSDSSVKQWFANAAQNTPFGEFDHASVPVLLNNNNPATIDLAGSMLDLILHTDKATQMTIAGDMIDCGFYGENLQSSGPASVTSINVNGQILNNGSFTSITLDQPFPTLPAADTPLSAPTGASLSSWFLPLFLALNPAHPQTILYPALDLTFIAYNPKTRVLTAIGPMAVGLRDVLETPTLTVPRYNSFGIPIGTDTINWVPGGSANYSLISSLYTSSRGASGFTPGGAPGPAYVVGGTGQFNITAGSISLGNSAGILSVFDGVISGQFDYSFLAPYLQSGIKSGASINVTVLDSQQTVNGLTEPSLYIPASTIAVLGSKDPTVLGSGDLTVSVPNGSIDLGSPELLPFETDIISANHNGLGIYTTAGGNVTVKALGDINIDSSRIATFDGGDIWIESYTGNVNAGSGGTVAIPINYFAPNFTKAPVESIPANGIVAGTLTASTTIPPGAARSPGNITVIAAQGSIFADLGGISQQAFGETLSSANATSTIGLFAGTPLNFNNDWYSQDNNWTAKPPAYVGNIDLGASGVIGVNVFARATGKIDGLIVSQLNADVTAAQSFAGTVFAGGKATISSSGNISGTIIAIGGVNTSGSGTLSANVFSSSVNGGAGTLATSSSASSTSASAAGQTSTETQQQVANNNNPNEDDSKKKKAGLARTVGRVTVVLPKAG
jgi:filamentous hemagglutinin family protein